MVNLSHDFNPEMCQCVKDGNPDIPNNIDNYTVQLLWKVFRPFHFMHTLPKCKCIVKLINTSCTFFANV